MTKRSNIVTSFLLGRRYGGDSSRPLKCKLETEEEFRRFIFAVRAAAFSRLNGHAFVGLVRMRRKEQGAELKRSPSKKGAPDRDRNLAEMRPKPGIPSDVSCPLNFISKKTGGKENEIASLSEENANAVVHIITNCQTSVATSTMFRKYIERYGEI